MKYDQCLNTVLLNELLKFNKLHHKVTDTCINLQKAVKGLVIFSPELEAVANGMLTNTQPPSWKGVSYPSLKPMMGYVFDFIDRLKFMDDWIKQVRFFSEGVGRNISRRCKEAVFFQRIIRI